MTQHPDPASMREALRSLCNAATESIGLLDHRALRAADHRLIDARNSAQVLLLSLPSDAPLSEAPSDEDVEAFLAERMTPEGRVPMVRTIRDALVKWGNSPSQPEKPAAPVQGEPLPGASVTWQHDETGRICEREHSPGPHWSRVDEPAASTPSPAAPTAPAANTREIALESALREIIKCDDDAARAAGNPRANLNGVGLVDLFDLIGHPFGTGKHKARPGRSNHLDVALQDARAALSTAAVKAAEVPVGWRLVPIEPTLAIIDALRGGSRRDWPSDELCRVRWAAALGIATAPAQGKAVDN